MEKIIDSHIWFEYLSDAPLHKMQCTYQSGKSTETALHNLVTKIEKTLQSKEIALTAFLDIEGAFDRTGFSCISQAAETKRIETSTVNWIMEMLQCRIISANLGGDSVTIKATRGCPQGGVLSPLLWSLVIDRLLNILSSEGLEVICYADDIVIVVRGKFDSIICDRLQVALDLVWDWCLRNDLSVNASKTVIIPFTRKTSLKLIPLHLGGSTLEFQKETKYLGVMLDSKLLWNSHLSMVITKATNCWMACRNLIGKKWGLNPKMILWLYLTVIRPIILYAAFIWWPKTLEVSAKAKLAKLQRLPCLAITGAMRSSPTVALEALLDLIPLSAQVQYMATLTGFRYHRDYGFLPGDLTGHLKICERLLGMSDILTVSDCMPIAYNFDLPFDIVIPNRTEWAVGPFQASQNSLSFFTDGS